MRIIARIPMPKRNISEDWFRASEAAGDLMGIHYGRIRPQAGAPKWHVVPHCECDGIGGFARLLRAQGANLPSLPETQHPCREVAGPLWRLWKDRLDQPDLATRRDWLPETPAAKPAPEHMAWHLFSREETRDLLARCRELQCTVNSVLLHGLDQTVRSEIRKPAAAIPWLIPVNLRGDLRYADDTRNHVSCVDVAVEAGATPQDIQRRVRRQLERGEHRANHLLLALGGILSHPMKVRAIRKSRSKPAGNIGSFSNLGVWSSDHPPVADDGWVFCPPVVSGQLLAAGCVTFNGRLGLATHGLPAAVSPAERMAEWVGRIGRV